MTLGGTVSPHPLHSTGLSGSPPFLNFYSFQENLKKRQALTPDCHVIRCTVTLQGEGLSGDLYLGAGAESEQPDTVSALWVVGGVIGGGEGGHGARHQATTRGHRVREVKPAIIDTAVRSEMFEKVNQELIERP